MTLTRSAPPRVTYAKGLMQALSAVQSLAGLHGDLGEHTTVRTRFCVAVRSEAEVDGAAALLGVIPARTSPWRYEAVSHLGTVTVAVIFTDDPAAGPADMATIDSICGQAASEIHGNVA